MKKLILGLASVSILFVACNNETPNNSKPDTKTEENKSALNIISLNGTVSEILVGLGLESSISGVDVTSVYPETLKAKTQLGSSHSFNMESIIASKPNYVVGTKERGLKPEQIAQLQQAGIAVWVIDQEYSIDGTKKMIAAIADTFKKQDAAKAMIQKIDDDIASIKKGTTTPKVLFIYARGAGTLQVAGNGTPLNSMIQLADGVPAMGTSFEGFKPLTTEALVVANPDYILLFDSGLKSLEGAAGVLAVPGVDKTNAGKNKAIIEMDGLKLSGFGPRVGEAIKELNAKIHP